MSFFSELRRRSIFKVGAVYLIVAWLIAQVIDVLNDPLSLPGWFDTVVILLLAIGFPVALLLAWAYELTPSGIRPTVSTAPTGPTASASGQRFNYVILGLVVVAVGFLLLDRYVLEESNGGPGLAAVPSDIGSNVSVGARAGQATEAPVRRFNLDLGGARVAYGLRGGGNSRIELALSPDGRTLAFTALTNAGDPQLVVRSLEQLEYRPVPNTEGAAVPFFSPDGRTLGFFTFRDYAIKLVGLAGGTPQSIVSLAGGVSGVSWERSDQIIISTSVESSGMARLARVPSRGGELEALTGGFASSGGGFSVWPDVLPGGVGVLFTRREGGAPANDSDLFLFLPETGEVRELVARAYHAKYAPSGHIVFVRDGSLWAIPFDLERLETAGAAVTVVENVDTNGLSGSSGYAFSDTGLLVYLPGGDIHDTLGRTFSWVGPNGEEEPLGIEPRSFDRPRLSPDRQQLAVAIDDVGNRDIWVYDLQRGTRNRLTISEETDDAPVWTPDGEKVVFSSTREGGGIFSRRADGAGGVERIGPNVESAFAGIFGLTPESIDPNQQWLVFREGQPSDLKMLSLGEDGEVVTLLDSEADEDYSEISPDGQYLAYESRQSGIEEVYVRPFPDVNDGRWWQVSLDGGQEPHWSPDGTRLFYRKGETLAIIAADVELEPTFSVTARRTVFEGGDVALNEPTYGISADGQRLLVMRAGERRAEPIVSTSLVVVDNWFEELRRLAPLAE